MGFKMWGRIGFVCIIKRFYCILNIWFQCQPTTEVWLLYISTGRLFKLQMMFIQVSVMQDKWEYNAPPWRMQVHHKVNPCHIHISIHFAPVYRNAKPQSHYTRIFKNLVTITTWLRETELKHNLHWMKYFKQSH